ncbi:hypothetical protein L208DRAFT_428387, partial [Tricholoma matsutake]
MEYNFQGSSPLCYPLWSDVASALISRSVPCSSGKLDGINPRSAGHSTSPRLASIAGCTSLRSLALQHIHLRRFVVDLASSLLLFLLLSNNCMSSILNTYLNELQWFLAIHHDIIISISALQVNLDKAGLTRKILHKIAKERDKECRPAYHHCIQNDFSG